MISTPLGPDGSEGSLEIGGYALAYRSAGDGPPLVLVHGMITDHGLWGAHLSGLCKGFHVITPTLRYFGASPWPDRGERFSMDQQAADLGDLLEALDLGPVHLVGWSLGGAVAVILAADRPHLIKDMLLYEPSLLAAVTDRDDLEAGIEDRTAMFTAAKIKFEAGEGAAAIEAFVDGANDREGTFRQFPKELQQIFHRNVRVLTPFFGGPPPPRITAADIDTIATPTTLGLGEESRRFWQIAVPAFQKRMPAASLVRLPGRRHMWPAEAPQDFSKFVIDGLGA